VPRVPDGFRAETVLQAPDIEAPTALCVAPNGDVYFAEDPMDMAGPPTKNLDRIWLLKGGDPRKKILIADKMWAVMGLEIVRDKLYVVHAPHVTVFTLDADGKPKERKELFDDLGPPVAGAPSFNDHIPSGIRMGMDGWLYVSIGDKGIPKMARKELDKGSVHVAEGRWHHSKEGHHISLEGGGVIRFRPDGSGLEVFASGTRNHLDVPMDEQDRIFVRDNTDDGLGWNTRLMYLPPGGFMGYPWAYTKHPEETLPMIHDFGGGSPCGGWVYCDDGLPETYRGRIFHCEWGQGKVYGVKVAPDGAGFKYVDQITFMDPEGTGVYEFRPFTLRPTADGRGFYVTDWGYGGWLNPTKAGRLWKVTYVKDGVRPLPRGKDSDSIAELIKSLDHPAHSERLRAQQVLIARGKEASNALHAALEQEKLSSRATRHALWALRELDLVQGVGLALFYTGHQDPTVREQANRVLATAEPENLETKETREAAYKAQIVRMLGQLQKATAGEPEDSARVRLQSVLASQNSPSSPDARRLLQQYAKEPDRFVRSALVHALRHIEAPQLAKQFNPTWLSRADVRLLEGLCLALVDQPNAAAVALLRCLLEHSKPAVRKLAVNTLARVHHVRKPYAGTWWGTQPAGQQPPPRNVAWEGTTLVRDALLRALADKDAGVRKAVVTGLLEMNDPQSFQPLRKQFQAETNLKTRVDIVRAIAGLNTPEAVDFLGTILHTAGNPEALRQEALAGLEKANTPVAVARVADAAADHSPVALRVRALEALGDMKAKSAQATCAAALKNSDAGVRRAAAGALAKLGDPTSALALLPLLEDKDTQVRRTVIQALGTLKARAAVPPLLKASADASTQFEALGALAQMPDPRALSAYLTGLGSKNVELRQASRQALVSVCEAVAPVLEQLAKRNELPADLFPELRSIYASFAPILDWRIIGPFPNDGKAYPPERERKFNASYVGSDQNVRWQAIRADAGQHGRVNLVERFNPNSNVVVYGYAEVESATDRNTEILIGSDDSIIVWLNGQKVHEYPGDRAWAHDQDKVTAKLQKGKNRLLIKCGNHSGPWDFSVAVSADAGRYAFLQGGKQKLDLEAFRAYARKNSGDPERGRKLFLDLKGLACAKCHALGGQGSEVGPDLAGIGLKYKREDLMASILEPSKVIAQGYETIVITTTRGLVLTGVFKGETADAINLTDSEGKRHSVAKKEIEDRSFSPVSTMPNGLSDGMTLQDFADLVAFLEARREEKAPTKK
jgi:putative heme-binding domain-containing protein